MVLAGMLELADREFQAVHNQDRELTAHATQMVSSGDLTGVEITPQSLKLFLDKKLGADWRISDWSYDWTARLLKSLGFRDLRQVESAISEYNDDELNRIAYEARQGQLSRFELMLLAALGERFVDRHPSKADPWFGPFRSAFLAKFREKGIRTSTYDPLADPAVTAPTTIQNMTLVPATTNFDTSK